MKIVKIVAAVSVLCLPLAAVSTPVMAATAHNSQLGAGGPKSDAAGSTGMHKRYKQFRNRARGM